MNCPLEKVIAVPIPDDVAKAIMPEELRELVEQAKNDPPSPVDHFEIRRGDDRPEEYRGGEGAGHQRQRGGVRNRLCRYLEFLAGALGASLAGGKAREEKPAAAPLTGEEEVAQRAHARYIREWGESRRNRGLARSRMGR